jgi:hypothetical protein
VVQSLKAVAFHTSPHSPRPLVVHPSPQVDSHRRLIRAASPTGRAQYDLSSDMACNAVPEEMAAGGLAHDYLAFRSDG